jgi:hypothetical protein
VSVEVGLRAVQRELRILREELKSVKICAGKRKNLVVLTWTKLSFLFGMTGTRSRAIRTFLFIFSPTLGRLGEVLELGICLRDDERGAIRGGFCSLDDDVGGGKTLNVVDGRSV